jgi:hypothetical protein
VSDFGIFSWDIANWVQILGVSCQMLGVSCQMLGVRAGTGSYVLDVGS